MSDKVIEQSNLPCVYLPVPLSAKGRVIFDEKPTGAESLMHYMARIGLPVKNGIGLCVRINGDTIPFEWWDKVKPKSHVCITVISTVNFALIPLLLSAALSFAAPTIAAAIATSIGVTGAIAIAAIGVAVAVGGTLLIGAIFAPQVASSNSSLANRSGTNQQVSPTYDISGGSNATRRYQPLPMVLGGHVLFPDFSSIPYVQNEGDNKYLYQTFEFGVADVNISDIKIGTTLASEFEEIEIEESTFPSGSLDLFPANTLSTAGAVLEPEESTFTTRTSAIDAIALRVELDGDIVTLNSRTGKIKSDAMTLVIEYRLSSTAPSGPFTKLIDSTNIPKGITLDLAGDVVVTSKSRRKIRLSLYRTVDQDEYEVRVRRVPSNKDGSSTSTRAMTWTQLLSHQKDGAAYENRKRMAIRVRASGQINGALDTLSAFVSTPIPVWNGSSEDTLESSNPGHIFIFFARGSSNADGRRRFGGLLQDSRIDLDGLRVWADWCDDNDLKCDFVIDTSMPTSEVLSIVARCGRATVAWNTGKIGVVFDQEGLAPVQVFGMFNIKRDPEFSVTYITENLANEIVVSYIDRDRDYQRNQVRVGVPGESANDRPANIDLVGVTRLSQAAEEANLMAATQFYRRRRVTFSTDLENLVAVRGDVITLAHDLTAWALSGRLITGTDSTLLLDREIQVTAQSFLTIRSPDLTITSHTITTPPGLVDTVTIDPVLSLAPDDDTDNKVKDYVWLFEDSSSPGKDFKIVGIDMDADFTATISAVEEVAAYYESAAGDFDFADNNLYNRQVASVTDLAFSEALLDTLGSTALTISWVAVQAISVDVEVTVNSGPASIMSGVVSNSMELVTQGGDIIDIEIRVNAIVLLRSSQTVESATYTVLGLDQLPADVPTFLVARNGDVATFRWGAVFDIDLDIYEIRKGSNWDSSILIEKTKSLSHQVLDVTEGTYLIKAVDTGGRQSQTAIAAIIGSGAEINVVLQDNEQDSNWPGVFDDTLVNIDNELVLAGDSTWLDLTEPWDTYTNPWQLVAPSKSIGNYITDVFDLGSLNDEATRVDIEIIVDVTTAGYTWESLDRPWTTYDVGWTWLGPEGRIAVSVEIQTSDDDITYTDFAEFVPGAFNARYYKFRITLESLDPNALPRVKEFNVTYDVPDRVETFNDTTISIGGTTITYNRVFKVVPNVQVNLQSASEGDTHLVTSKTISGSTVTVFDDSGTDIGGNVDVNVTGY